MPDNIRYSLDITISRDKNAPFPWSIRAPLNTLPWAHLNPHPNGVSIGSAVLAQLTVVTNRNTHRPRYICSNIHGRVFALHGWDCLRCGQKT